MPHLIFRNVEEFVVSNISEVLVGELATAFECSESDITFELLHASSYIAGKKVEGDWTVDVKMFERSKTVCDKVCSILTTYLSKNYQGDIAIIFHNLEPNLYYENGKSF